MDLGGATARGPLAAARGAPLGEDIRLWWNFVARTQDEISQAYEAWQVRDTARFGDVSAPLARIEAPSPPWLGGDGGVAFVP